ncbi:hypothetical protein STIAU_6387 [Stigmatella aurantiaca DW4/3-1]|uniref:Uncharacterized protein n=1 Tax=Stigmatella aurantiaca (strain DW4/3-1) TaxID=378806 RepID=Q08ND7_STIAD|nr:hypothetical protein STIAU_6387 [Stigmatella aurantiaca DW4/3-1]
MPWPEAWHTPWHLRPTLPRKHPQQTPSGDASFSPVASGLRQKCTQSRLHEFKLSQGQRQLRLAQGRPALNQLEAAASADLEGAAGQLIRSLRQLLRAGRRLHQGFGHLHAPPGARHLHLGLTARAQQRLGRLRLERRALPDEPFSQAAFPDGHRENGGDAPGGHGPKARIGGVSQQVAGEPQRGQIARGGLTLAVSRRLHLGTRGRQIRPFAQGLQRRTLGAGLLHQALELKGRLHPHCLGQAQRQPQSLAGAAQLLVSRDERGARHLHILAHPDHVQLGARPELERALGERGAFQGLPQAHPVQLRGPLGGHGGHQRLGQPQREAALHILEVRLGPLFARTGGRQRAPGADIHQGLRQRRGTAHERRSRGLLSVDLPHHGASRGRQHGDIGIEQIVSDAPGQARIGQEGRQGLAPQRPGALDVGLCDPQVRGALAQHPEGLVPAADLPRRGGRGDEHGIIYLRLKRSRNRWRLSRVRKDHTRNAHTEAPKERKEAKIHTGKSPVRR